MENLVPHNDAGDIDTVVVAFTDMQGRLQGKRLHGRHVADVVVPHRTEGCHDHRSVRTHPGFDAVAHAADVGPLVGLVRAAAAYPRDRR